MDIIRITKELQRLEASNFSYDLFDRYDTNNVKGSYDSKLVNAMKSCIYNGTQMNTFLFTLPVNKPLPVVWLGKTKNKFVWVTGYLNTDTLKVRNLIESALPILKNNDLTKFSRLPPYLLYIDVYKQSNWQNDINDDIETKVSDFSIFQVEPEDEDIEDIDQLMVMNSNFLNDQVKNTFKVMLQYCNHETNNYFENEVLSRSGLLTKLHTDLHNIGHFMGAFPYSKACKDISDYEVVEEFKACLTAIEIINHIELNETEKNAFALLVVCTRIFNYGYRSHFVKNKTQQIIREITVAVLFFEMLKNHSVIKFDKLISIDIGRIREIASKELNIIYNQETKACEDNNLLSQFAVHHFKKAYPNAKLSSELARLYT